MDLSAPIRSVIPSLTGPVLQVLARSNAPASLSEIHRRSGDGSVSGVRKVLEHLVVHGLATKGPAGYALNRDHLAAEAVMALATLHGAFAERVRAWLDRRPEHVIAAGLYGSMARRDGGPDSDIDLLVVVSDSTDGAALRDDLAEAVRRWTGNEGQVLVLTPSRLDALRDREGSIVASWERDLLMLAGERSEVVG